MISNSFHETSTSSSISLRFPTTTGLRGVRWTEAFEDLGTVTVHPRTMRGVKGVENQPGDSGMKVLVRGSEKLFSIGFGLRNGRRTAGFLAPGHWFEQIMVDMVVSTTPSQD